MMLRTLVLALVLSCGVVPATALAQKPAKTKAVKSKPVKSKTFKPKKFKPKKFKPKKDKRFENSKVASVRARKPVKH